MEFMSDKELFRNARRYGNHELNLIHHGDTQGLKIHTCDWEGKQLYRPVQMEAWKEVAITIKNKPKIWEGVSEVAVIFPPDMVLASSHTTEKAMLIAGSLDEQMWVDTPAGKHSPAPAPIAFVDVHGVQRFRPKGTYDVDLWLERRNNPRPFERRADGQTREVARQRKAKEVGG